MIIIVKKDHTPQELEQLKSWLAGYQLGVHISEGIEQTVVGLIGDASAINVDQIRSMEIVEDVRRIQEPYKKASRKFYPQDTVVDVGGVKIGGGHFALIAGPCSVESKEQIIEAARRIKSAGATLLRGGSFKPRTSPYAFQGLRGHGIELLLEAKKETGLPIVTEIMDLSQLTLFDEVDMIQLGARNMQNFELLKELGQLRKPILLKRGLANTIEEFLMSAEYILSGGNMQVVLCERGIRTFETAMRNTLDLAAVPLLKSLSHLPVVVDPSHATGMAKLVKPTSLGAVAVGCDGLMIEVHPNPAKALCDGPQSLSPDSFNEVAAAIFAIRPHAFKW